MKKKFIDMNFQNIVKAVGNFASHTFISIYCKTFTRTLHTNWLNTIYNTYANSKVTTLLLKIACLGAFTE